MTQGEMGPESAIGPQPIFNIAALPDARITAYSRAMYQASGAEDGLDLDGILIDDLHDALASGVRDHVGSDPERVVGLVRQSAQGEHPADLYFAALVSPGLLDHDYEFARNTFIDIYAESSRDETLLRVRGECVRVLEDLMTERLNAEQAADFNARLQPHGLEFRVSDQPTEGLSAEQAAKLNARLAARGLPFRIESDPPEVG